MSKVNEHRPGYKYTPLGWIPEGWSIKEFGKFASISKSKYTPSADEDRHCIELEHIDQDTGNINGFISSANQRSTKNAFRKGQVLFGKLRPYLRKYWLAAFDGVCSSEVWVLQANTDDCCNEYLFRLVQQHRFMQATNVSSGSKMPRADWDFVAEFPFALPTYPEQRKIAAILSIWDEAITKTQQLITQLQQRNKGLMQGLLTGKKRLKGFEDTKWDYVPMNVLFERVQRKISSAAQDIDVLTISGRFGFLSQKEKFNRVIAGKSLKNYTMLREGEFSYNKGNSSAYQYGCVFRLNSHPEALVPNVYISFKAIGDIEATFYSYYFKHDLLKPSLAKIISSGARMDGLLNVNAEDFFKIRILVPSLKEQVLIGQILESSNSEINLYQQKLATLQEQKKGLMQKLLTGEVRVKIDKENRRL